MSKVNRSFKYFESMHKIKVYDVKLRNLVRLMTGLLKQEEEAHRRYNSDSEFLILQFGDFLQITSITAVPKGSGVKIMMEGSATNMMRHLCHVFLSWIENMAQNERPKRGCLSNIGPN